MGIHELECEEPCATCGGHAVSRCSRCFSVRYCSKGCQKNHWRTHKANCKPIKEEDSTALHRNEPGEEVGKCAVCNSSGRSSCSNCRRQSYCSRQCQRQHWQQHKKDCFPFKAEHSDLLGRYFVATRPLKAGEVILKEDPLVLGPLEPSVLPCLGCYAAINGNYRCRKCFWPLCGPKCEDSPDHEPECRLTRAAKKEVSNFGIDDYRVILPIRCMALKDDTSKLEKLLGLQNHNEDRKSNSKKMAVEQDVINLLRDKLNIKYETFMKGDSLQSFVSHVMGIFDVNGFEIILGNVDIMGLFPGASLMEHSCTPNTKHKFTSSNQLLLKAAVDIAKGDHVSTSYTGILWGTLNRRKDLLEHKYFSCICQRCSDPTEQNSYFSALKCRNCKDGYILPANSLDVDSKWICNGCGTSISAADAESLTKQLGDEAERLLEHPELTALENYITESIATKVHGNHFHLLKAKHTLLQMYGRGSSSLTDSVLKKKERLCQDVLQLCSLIDPGDARLGSYTGVALFEYQNIVMTRVQKMSGREYPDQENIDQGIALAKTLLKRCIKALHDENEDLPQGKLRLVAQQKLTELGLLTSNSSTKLSLDEPYIKTT